MNPSDHYQRVLVKNEPRRNNHLIILWACQIKSSQCPSALELNRDFSLAKKYRVNCTKIIYFLQLRALYHWF